MAVGFKYDGTDLLFYNTSDGANIARLRSGTDGVLFYDDIPIVLGDNADASIKYDETTDDRLEIACATGIDLDGDVTMDHTDHTLNIANFGSTADGSGVAISSSRTAALKVFGDTGSVALTAGAVRCAWARMLLGTEPGAADISVFGIEGQLKIPAVDASPAAGNLAGVWAYLESISGSTVGDRASGLYAMLDVPSGATIAAGAFVSGVHISSNSLDGTHTGDAACLYMTTPGAGAWDYFAKFEASCGMTTQAGGSITITDKILVKTTGGNDRYIPVGTIA